MKKLVFCLSLFLLGCGSNTPPVLVCDIKAKKAYTMILSSEFLPAGRTGSNARVSRIPDADSLCNQEISPPRQPPN